MPRTDLPTNRLDGTDMYLTRVGFGAWAVGGAGYAFGRRAQDDADSIAAVRYAVEHGVNWIDTAAVYGLGHSEEVVREALAPYSEEERPYVFTKGGLVWDDDDRSATPRRVGAAASLRRELDASLRRLGVERIDLYQMHWPPNDQAGIEEYWGQLLEFRKAGKVRAVGLSNHAVAQLAEAESLGHVDSLQPPFSAIDRDAASSELGWAVANDTGVIVYSPMQSGLLTGAFSRKRVAALPADDWRRTDPDFVGAALDRNLDLARRTAYLAHRRGVPMPALAVAWTLAWPGVTGAIVGARNPDQVLGWLPAAELTLTAEDLDEMAEAIERSGAGSGPTRP